MKRKPYPLQWPDGWKRTQPNARRKSHFGNGRTPLSAYQTGQELLDELDRLGGANYVITSFLPTRDDGLPYSDGRSEDPGIAVWFVLEGHERVFACDAWTTAAENMRAIAKSVSAMRGIERWGMADVIGRAFAGFVALPAGDPPRPSWRVIFQVEGLELAGEDLLAVVKARHRKMISAAHPDQGGDTDAASALNTALDDATRDLSPPPCVVSMGCLCAGHARGVASTEPCNTSES